MNLSEHTVISDGFHTMDELYRHRAVLFSLVVKIFSSSAWKSKRHADGSMFDGMFVVGVQTPCGQATYHYYIDPYWDQFDCKELDFAPEWDGHTSDDVLLRLQSLKESAAVGSCQAAQVPSARWTEVPVLWKTRRKFECSHCHSYVAGRFRDVPVESIHKICHQCGAAMTGTDELSPKGDADSNG